MKKLLLPTILGFLIFGNQFASAYVHTLTISPTNNTPTCTCQIETSNNQFNSAVYATSQIIYRTYTDYPDDLQTFTDQTDTYTKALSAESSHPTYKQALQSCNMTIKALATSGACSANSVMPAVGDLAVDEIGERTRYFNLSAREEAQLQFALAMAKLDSNEQFYRRIAEIYENKSYEDREFLLELLSQVRPVIIKQTKSAGRHHRH